MILNDILIVVGSVLKIRLERRLVEEIYHYNICSLLLGTGNLLVWSGLLRYLGFFRQYNILVLTMKRALPNVIRYMFCALLIYSGFCFCGWLVLGPYHLKFKSLSRTSECLFSLINGDDMFATFAGIIETEDTMIWWFSRIYLYFLIALFIYVVLSLFIAIIMDSYDTITEYYEKGFPLSDMKRFIAECPDDASSSIYLSDAEEDTVQNAFSNCWHGITSMFGSESAVRRPSAYQRIGS